MGDFVCQQLTSNWLEKVEHIDARSWTMWCMQNGLFTVKSMYRALLGTQAMSFNTFFWKLKLPLKIKVFIWYLYNGVILTKDNLVRRQWQGIGNVVFVPPMSLFNTYFLTAILLSLFGGLFRFPSIYHRQPVYTTFLQAGWRG
jgi:hypothetical protein